MSFDLAKILSALRLSAKHFVVVAVVSGFLLFAPGAWQRPFALEALREAFRPWISLIFFVSVGLAFAYGLSAAWSAWKRHAGQATQLAARGRIMQYLGDDEKDVLATFVVHNVRVWRFPADNGASSALVSKRVLYRPTQAFTVFHGFQYGIQPWAWEYLGEHPEVLDGAHPFGEQSQNPSDWLRR